MRSIQVEKVRDAVRDMCIEANYSLSPDMRCVFEKACQEEYRKESVLVIQKDTFGNPLLEIPFCESIPGTIHPACSIMKLCPETA